MSAVWLPEEAAVVSLKVWDYSGTKISRYFFNPNAVLKERKSDEVCVGTLQNPSIKFCSKAAKAQLYVKQDRPLSLWHSPSLHAILDSTMNSFPCGVTVQELSQTTGQQERRVVCAFVRSPRVTSHTHFGTWVSLAQFELPLLGIYDGKLSGTPAVTKAWSDLDLVVSCLKHNLPDFRMKRVVRAGIGDIDGTARTNLAQARYVSTYTNNAPQINRPNLPALVERILSSQHLFTLLAFLWK